MNRKFHKSNHKFKDKSSQKFHSSLKSKSSFRKTFNPSKSFRSILLKTLKKRLQSTKQVGSSFTSMMLQPSPNRFMRFNKSPRKLRKEWSNKKKSSRVTLCCTFLMKNVNSVIADQSTMNLSLSIIRKLRNFKGKNLPLMTVTIITSAISRCWNALMIQFLMKRMNQRLVLCCMKRISTSRL